jgi:hypothetical protein
MRPVVPLLVLLAAVACATPSGPAQAPRPQAPPPPTPAPPPAPTGPDPAWDVVGFWDAGEFAPGCAVSVMRYASFGTRASLDCGDAQAPDLELDDPVLDGGYLRVDVEDTPHSLDRWRPTGVKVLPSEAVVRAVAAWRAQRSDPPVVESVQESADFFTFGSGSEREWVVDIETPHPPNTVVMPATLSIRVDVATGQTGPITGR